MAIPREAIEKVVADHPDAALVGVPFRLQREIFRDLLHALPTVVSESDPASPLVAVPVGLLRALMSALPVATLPQVPA
ncbi:hypothetical protein [Sphingomonas sp. VNH70]|uniref:hypothetical protein n=1 Tax=Sphingomonas silueang TaxID=3156617 RepID=UPI0032B3BB5A